MKFRQGSSIIEVLIAATLISIAILASLALSSRNQKQTDFSQSLNKATYYNTEIIDWISNTRTVMGWAEFAEAVSADSQGGATTYCLNSLPSNGTEFIALSYQSDCGVTTTTDGFQREITITLDTPPTTATLIVTTLWDNRERQVSAESKVTQW